MNYEQSGFGAAVCGALYLLPGRLFNYGDVFLDAVGRWDIDTSGIKHPDILRAFLESLINSQTSSGFAPTHIIAN